MAPLQSRDGDEGRQVSPGTDPPGPFPLGTEKRRNGEPFEDPDIEAFLQMTARIVLRMKGLAGKVAGTLQEEKDVETA